MKKKEILFISENFYPEDFGINDLIFEFANKGYSVKVLTQNPSYPFDKIYEGFDNRFFSSNTYNNVKIFRVKTFLGRKKNAFRKVFSYLYFSIISSLFILRIIGETKKIFIYQVGPLTQIVPALFAKLFYKVEIYLWVLDLWPQTVYAYGFKKSKINKILLNIFCKISYKYSKKIFVSNKGFIDEIVKFNIDSSKLLYCPQWIPNNINFQIDLEDSSFNKNKLNFVFAGNIGMVQNLEIIIKAFSEFNVTDLNIIGDGSNLDNLKKLVKKNNYNNIIFWGRKPLHEMANWLLSADILIISLIDKDTFNLTVPAKFQAYLGAKKPIFGIINGETSKLINDLKLGLTAEANNLDQIKSQIKLFIQDYQKNDFKKYSLNNDDIVNQFYDFDNTLNKFEKNIFNN